MTSTGISARTAWLAVTGLFAVLTIQLLGMPTSPLGESAALYVSDFGEAALVALAAAVALWMAAGLGRGSQVSRQWTLIGLGIASFAVGDTIWAVLEAVMGQEPFPSLADAFYSASYLFIAAGIILAIIGYYRLVRSRSALALAFAVAAVVGVALYLLLLRDVLADPELEAGARWLSLAYPLADLLLEFGPALCVLFLVRKIGTGRLAWPWWVASAGAICLAITDSGFSWAQYAGADITAMWLGAGWMLGFVLLAVAASVARDVGRPVAV